MIRSRFLVVAVLSFFSIGPLGMNIAHGGDGPPVSRTVPEFSGVQVASGIHAAVRFGAPQRVVLLGDKDLLTHVVTEVTGGRLVVKMDGKPAQGGGVKVEITSPRIEFLGGSGGSEVRASEVAGEHCEVKLSGGSTAMADGQVRSLSVAVSGGGQANLGHLTAASVTIQMSGGSHGQVVASKEITGALSGGSELSVLHSPAARRIATSGGSKVRYE